MNNLIDLIECKNFINSYGGSEVKRKILYKDRVYMVKFPDRVRQKNNSLHYMNNIYSEDIGCKIYKTLGFPVQNTFLAKYTFLDGTVKPVVACEDFTQDGQELIEFQKLSLQFESSDSMRSRVNIDSIMEVVNNTPQIADKEAFKKLFWDMFVVDGLIGNRDRNLENFGVLCNADDTLSFSPVYDCGSSLSPLLSEEKIAKRLSDENEFKREELNVYSCFRENRNRILISEYMKHPHSELRKAIKRMAPKITSKLEDIAIIINETPMISDNYKSYIKRSLALRNKMIIQSAYNAIQKESQQ